MISGGMNLVALGVGYIVYVAGAKEKEGTKFLGQAIGILIMIGAVLCILCTSAAHCMKNAGMAGCPIMDKKQCSMMEKKHCPISEQP